MTNIERAARALVAWMDQQDMVLSDSDETREVPSGLLRDLRKTLYCRLVVRADEAPGQIDSGVSLESLPETSLVSEDE